MIETASGGTSRIGSPDGSGSVGAGVYRRSVACGASCTTSDGVATCGSTPGPSQYDQALPAARPTAGSRRGNAAPGTEGLGIDGTVGMHSS